MPYRHTQPGIVILAVCLVIGVISAAIASQTELTPMIVALTILIAVAIIF